MKKITRRSFIKKSTAAGIAAANVTVFSGLINASAGSGSYSSVTISNCASRTKVSGNPKRQKLYLMWPEADPTKPPVKQFVCFDIYMCKDSNGNPTGKHLLHSSGTRCKDPLTPACTEKLSLDDETHPFCPGLA